MSTTNCTSLAVSQKRAQAPNVKWHLNAQKTLSSVMTCTNSQQIQDVDTTSLVGSEWLGWFSSADSYSIISSRQSWLHTSNKTSYSTSCHTGQFIKLKYPCFTDASIMAYADGNFVVTEHRDGSKQIKGCTSEENLPASARVVCGSACNKTLSTRFEFNRNNDTSYTWSFWMVRQFNHSSVVECAAAKIG